MDIKYLTELSKNQFIKKVSMYGCICKDTGIYNQRHSIVSAVLTDLLIKSLTKTAV